jgi:glycosyltransferase involved in cell wall biosynthesis
MIHEHTLAGPLNAEVYAAAGLPTVLTVHGPVDADMRRFYRMLGDEVALMAISDRQRQLAPQLNWVATVHNAVDVRAWPYQEARGDYVLFLGRFHPHKAPHLAVEAVHAAGLPLVLAGKCAEPVEKEYFAREIEPRLIRPTRSSVWPMRPTSGACWPALDAWCSRCSGKSRSAWS